LKPVAPRSFRKIVIMASQLCWKCINNMGIIYNYSRCSTENIVDFFGHPHVIPLSGDRKAFSAF
jgi:hypothetical protein